MPNMITAAGLEVASQAELVAEFTQAFQLIYGADINLDQDSPDGQMMMIFIQAVLDLEDLLMQIYSTFDPDNAIGVTLDQRVAINGIQRQAGTYTITNIAITVDRALNLPGADQEAATPFTVADAEGNKWLLISSISIGSAGAYELAFRAEFPGEVFTTPNTITIPVTIILGVTAINNPETYTTLGINEETDADLKIRRQRSVSISSQGYLAGLLAALENIPEVNSAFVYENATGSTDGDGIPSHSIWVIVSGTADDADIARAIYQKRNAGCGMKGEQTYAITQPDGSSFVIRWDNVETEDFFAQFNVTSIDGVNVPNYAAIRSSLAVVFSPAVAESANINQLATYVQDIDSNTLVTSAGLGTSSSSVVAALLAPSAKNKQLILSEDRIIILPVYLSPTAATVVHGQSQTFGALGGYGTYTYAIKTNNSGGSIGSLTGVYTAGSSSSVVDVIKVTDGLSNTVSVSVAVT